MLHSNFFDFIAATELRSAFTAGDGNGQMQVKFLQQQVGRQCFCKLLGIGKKRLHRARTLCPDMRIGKDKRQSRASTNSVDAFLALMYTGVAETLPDRRAGVLRGSLSDRLP